MKKTIKEIFAANLRKAMDEKGMSQKQLSCDATGTIGTISKYLNPDKDDMPRADRLLFIAQAVGVSCDWLLTDPDEPKANNQLTMQDLGRVLLQCLSLPGVNMRTQEITCQEFCIDDESPEGRNEANSYAAFYFSDWFPIYEFDPYGPNHSPIGSALNSFIQKILRYNGLYAEGNLPEDIYHTLIESALAGLGNSPLQTPTNGGSSNVI